ncbi:Uncharacterised protein [Fusobacterium necrophorum subsp. necrophorum]|nr:Uncharacterised protein [Fusobacterium necrophorum subsp. necrophorum]
MEENWTIPRFVRRKIKGWFYLTDEEENPKKIAKELYEKGFRE